MPAPLTVDSNRTGLPVWSVDDNGNVVQIGGLTVRGAVVLSNSVSLSGAVAISGSTGPLLLLTGLAGGQVLLSAVGADSATEALQGMITGDTAERFDLRVDGTMFWGGGSSPVDTKLYRASADKLATDDDFLVNVAGKGVRIKEGTNAKMGTGTLAGGTLVVANTSVTATSRIFLTAQSVGGTAGALAVTARTAGTGFTVTSTSGADTSVFAYLIIEPA
jgi:hypothetical protein